MRDHIIVTLVDKKGSAPQEVGAKMTVTRDGLESGTIGGGKIEKHCIEYAQDMMSKKSKPILKTWNLQTDIGMSCGGKVSLFFETHYEHEWDIAIFGAGHVAQELTRVMSTWDANVRVFDNRAEWISKLPQSDNIEARLTDDLAQQVKALPQGTFVLCMTKCHSSDLPILVEAMKRHEDFPYIGAIGSDVKAEKLRMQLKEAGSPDLGIERLRCPLGLPIGRDTPAEISISIAAQLLEERG